MVEISGITESIYKIAAIIITLSHSKEKPTMTNKRQIHIEITTKKNLRNIDIDTLK